MRSGEMAFSWFAATAVIGTLVLTAVVFCELDVEDLYFHSPCGAHTAHRHHLIGNAETATSTIECGILCLANDDCNSYTFNSGRQSCELSTGMEKDCSLLTVEADSTYHEVIASGCNAPYGIAVGRNNCTCSPGYFGSNCRKSCPDGFIHINGTDGCYFLSSSSLQWPQAKADCQARGAMLACTENEAELTQIRNFLRTMFPTNVKVYLGLNDLATEGTWVCDGTGETIATGSYFVASQPDNHNGVQHCAFCNGNADYLLDDANCVFSTYYLCEKP